MNLESSKHPENGSIDKDNSKIKDDPISCAVGSFGRWQLQLTFLIALFNIPCTWQIFSYTFQTLPVDYWCIRDESGNNFSDTSWTKNESLKNKEYDPCFPLDSPCVEWAFNSTVFGPSLIAEWQLVCSKEQLPNVAEMMFLAGVAIGGLVSGLISDRFGRKHTLMFSLLIQVILGIGCAVTPWFPLFVILRFALGFICVAVVFSGLVLCMELVGGKWLTITGVSTVFPVPVAYILNAWIAYNIREWRSLQLAVSLPALVLLTFWRIIPESPRWLLALKRYDEVIEIVKSAAKTNGVKLSEDFETQFKQKTDSNLGNNENAPPPANVLDLFRNPWIRRKSLLLTIIWFSLNLVYYGLVLNLANLGGNIYLNTIISGLVEVPAIGLSIIFLLYRGRRWPLCLTLAGSGVACLVTLIVPIREELSWITIAFAMIGKFAVSLTYSSINVFTAELFPTVVRNLGVGTSNVSGGIALMLVPYLWNLAKINAHLPMGVLGVCGVIGGLSVLFLPETAGKPLVATLADDERIHREEKADTENSNKVPIGIFNKSFTSD